MTKQRVHNQAHFSIRQLGAVKPSLLATIAAAVGILIFAWYMLPQGYSTDTSLVGKGKPAIAIIYDSGNAASDELMASFNQVRGEFEAQVEFLIVDVDAPGGRQFANANAVATTSALFFSSDGRRIAVLYSPQKATVLNQMIRQKFSL